MPAATTYFNLVIGGLFTFYIEFDLAQKFFDLSGSKLAGSAVIKQNLLAVEKTVVKNNALFFIVVPLKDEQLRDDYRDFLEVAIILLGGISHRDISFTAREPMHQAKVVGILKGLID